jgi:HSP20 family protein
MAAVDPRNLMWTTACEMIDRAERLHRQFFQPMAAAIGEVSWEPPIDIVETDSEILITVALPGVDPNDVKVTVDTDGVSVVGFRRPSAISRGRLVHRLESPTENSDARSAFRRRALSLANRNLPTSVSR